MNFGNVMILSGGQIRCSVLAGLEIVYGEIGRLLPQAHTHWAYGWC